jgi:hypothetical protein
MFGGFGARTFARPDSSFEALKALVFVWQAQRQYN